MKRSIREFKHDDITDRGAALTYYGVLALFPAVLVLVSILGLAGKSTTRQVLSNLGQVAIAKWPVLVIIVSVMFSLLCKASPNVRQPAFRWISAGGILAVIAWLIASGLFAVYVSFSGSYNKTYGSLATVIIFLVWLWISNIAILLGAERPGYRRGIDSISSR